MKTNSSMARRWLQLVVGLFLYGIAIAVMVRATVGVGPWDVLSLGLAKQTGLSIGLLTNVVGALVLLLWIPLRQKPGPGTVVNVLLIGPSIEVGLAIVPAPTELWAQVPLFAAGLLLLAVASGIYIGARLGPGPRDGLMTGLNTRFGVRIWVARTAVEVTVLAVGWLLGGNVGFGTLAFALFIGPLVGFTIPFFRVPPPTQPRKTPRETEEVTS
jgi:uncharacterized membrane protein YczE